MVVQEVEVRGSVVRRVIGNTGMVDRSVVGEGFWVEVWEEVCGSPVVDFR